MAYTSTQLFENFGNETISFEEMKNLIAEKAKNIFQTRSEGGFLDCSISVSAI